MTSGDAIGLREFLSNHPEMLVAPARGKLSLLLEGTFQFSARPANGVEITDSYSLSIAVPPEFPHDIPLVRETGGRIPDDYKHHVNPGVQTLCLGSPIRLLRAISRCPSLVGFARSCLVPYLYAVSVKLRFGGAFVFGELAHGAEGVFEDYLQLFRLKTHGQVTEALRLLGTKRRLANKERCPCGCGRRLGQCKFHHTLNRYRGLATRSWFREHASQIGL